MSKKRGKKHSTLAVVPLGVKRNRYAIIAHAALLALRSGVAKHQNLVDLYVLAELCEKLTDAHHIHAHCASVRRLCDEIHDAEYQCTDLRYAAMEASANLLLEWLHGQKNAEIARMAMRMAGKLAE